ncbi:hypothetical protein Tco_0918569 [Tanacetum coccineum]
MAVTTLVSILLPGIGLNQVPWNELDLPDFTMIERVHLLEAKLFDALEHKSVVIEVDNQKIAIFTKAPLRAFGKPFMRYSLPCKVDGQGSWYTELDFADSANYVTEKVLENLVFMHVSLSDYSRKMVNDVNIEIHGVKFKADFVVLDYVNEGEPCILFGRDFWATTKSQVDFGLGEIRMNLTKFK